MRPREEEFGNLAKKVWAERLYQVAIYGTEKTQYEDLGTLAGYYTQKLAVLMEEVGEVARAVLECDTENLKAELIQSMAVCAAIYEFVTLDQGPTAFKQESQLRVENEVP